MSDYWLRRVGWGTAVVSLIILIVSILILWLAPGQAAPVWQHVEVSLFSALGAPVLGLLILMKQPRQRIGWLWIIYGLAIGLTALGNAIYFYGGSQPAGYSALEYFLLWVTQPANVTTLICLVLLILWFPDGQLVLRRWRFLYVWLFLALVALGYYWFMAGPNWNGGESAGGIVIDNPYGWLPEVTNVFGFLGFLSIVLITILALMALVLRYRSAGAVMRLQLRWFVFGGIVHVIFNFLPAFLLNPEAAEVAGIWRLVYLLGAVAIVPLYLAVGIAILRYRLFDIDLIIRKSLQYTALSALLALVYFGSVLLLQTVFGAELTDFPLLIVLSTLLIAALFAPLRQRVQAFIDRRFFRQKYDAQQILAQFAQTARDEVEMEALTAELIRVIQETMQPETTALWLKPTPALSKVETAVPLPDSP